MALIYNGTTIPNGANITYHNTALQKIIYNGVTVWVKQVIKPGSVLSVSASGETYPDLISFTYPNIGGFFDKPPTYNGNYYDNRAWFDSCTGEGVSELLTLSGGCIKFKKAANITISMSSLAFRASGTPNGIYNNKGTPKFRKNRVPISSGQEDFMNDTYWISINPSSYPPDWTGDVAVDDWIDLWCDGMTFGGGSTNGNDTTAWGQKAAIYRSTVRITVNSI